MKLPQSFYRRKTEFVARQLLGKTLVRVYRGQRVSGLITETEAYLGIVDPAAHSFGGRKTNRVQSMYLPGGHAYVYMIYGLHFCFNVVTRTAGHPEAVLIRALQPLEGIPLMQKFRQSKELKNLTTGPAKLCEALHIQRTLDGKDLAGDEIFIEDAAVVPRSSVTVRSRIGVAYAAEAAHWPLRFYIKGNSFISKK